MYITSLQKNTEEKGAAMITATVLLMLISVTLMLILINPIVRRLKIQSVSAESRETLYASEAIGEDVMYRLIAGMDISDVETITINGITATATSADVAGGKEISVNAEGNLTRKGAKTVLFEGSGAAFFYGIQTGSGGMYLENNTVINGNVYSNGSIEAVNAAEIFGNAVSAGPDGHIENITIHGSAWANNIEDSTVDGDAYYQTISGTTVGGISYPGSTDLDTLPMPILDSQIEQWKLDAEAGGVENCSGTFVIKTDQTIGPKKYTCNVRIEKNSTDITLTGSIWVEGDLTIKNAAELYIDSSLDGKSIAIIADNESDRLTSSRIITQNNSDYFGYGDNSYIVLISRNNSYFNGGSVIAIDMQNNATGDVILYAPEGWIALSNNAGIVESTGYYVTSSNNAVINYEQGAASILFSSGPAGGYTYGSWIPE
jgi:hypothetical protein